MTMKGNSFWLVKARRVKLKCCHLFPSAVRYLLIGISLFVQKQFSEILIIMMRSWFMAESVQAFLFLLVEFRFKDDGRVIVRFFVVHTGLGVCLPTASFVEMTFFDPEFHYFFRGLQQIKLVLRSQLTPRPLNLLCFQRCTNTFLPLEEIIS